jgi:thiamine kinase-like enzyme
MIPENKQTAVMHALQVAFGVSEFEEIQQLTVGLSSALIFKIVVKGKPYLLRVITRTDAMADPTHYYGCMKPAAEAGLAPRIWYADTADRISITDFVDAKPFPINEAKVLLPDTLRRLHALPRFPARLPYLDFMDNSIRKFQASNALPESITGEMFRQYERMKAVYPRNEEDLVSCHNDLKPDNILFDGKQAWLVDWEAAFLNDRYCDLAVTGNFVITNDNDEMDYLKIYFGKDATEYQQARFFLMRQIMHIIYFNFFMTLSSSKNIPIDLKMEKPGFRELHNRIWKGEIYLLDPVAQQQYAWVHLEQVLQHMQLKRFEEALRIVSDAHTT